MDNDDIFNKHSLFLCIAKLTALEATLEATNPVLFKTYFDHLRKIVQFEYDKNRFENSPEFNDRLKKHFDFE